MLNQTMLLLLHALKAQLLHVNQDMLLLCIFQTLLLLLNVFYALLFLHMSSKLLLNVIQSLVPLLHVPLLLLPHVLLQAGVVPAGLQGPQEGGHLVGPQGLREVPAGPAPLPAMTPSPSPDTPPPCHDTLPQS